MQTVTYNEIALRLDLTAGESDVAYTLTNILNALSNHESQKCRAWNLLLAGGNVYEMLCFDAYLTSALGWVNFWNTAYAIFLEKYNADFPALF